MLTREHAIFEYSNGRICPDRLTRVTHASYLRHAESMLRIYSRGIGRTRTELHRDVAALFDAEDDCPARRIGAFCKLLDDAGAYDTDPRGRAAALRRRVFRMAAPMHPIVGTADQLFDMDEAQAKLRIATEIGMPWKQIERELFADVMEFHRLREFTGYESPQALLSRYNVAQVQTALYRAVEMHVWARNDFKTLLRYAKLAKLMHTIERTAPGHYHIRFDGPASVMRQTQRYGVHMAAYLPAVLACRQWRLHARVATGRRGWTVSLNLDPRDGLQATLPAPDEFDSGIEEHFARKWGGEPRNGWSLERETEILSTGQKVFLPDFVFRHEDGRTALMEIVGFWTPAYLNAKADTLRTFAAHRILLAVPEEAAGQFENLGQPIVTYKTVLKLNAVMEALETQ